MDIMSSYTSFFLSRCMLGIEVKVGTLNVKCISTFEMQTDKIGKGLFSLSLLLCIITRKYKKCQMWKPLCAFQGINTPVRGGSRENKTGESVIL